MSDDFESCSFKSEDWLELRHHELTCRIRGQMLEKLREEMMAYDQAILDRWRLNSNAPAPIRPDFAARIAQITRVGAVLFPMTPEIELLGMSDAHELPATPNDQFLEMSDAREQASASPPLIAARLEVAGRDLASALKQIAKTKGIGRRNVFFEFQDGRLDIGFDEARIAIPAVGVWPGVAEVSRTFVKTMATFDLEKLTMIPIAYHDGRIIVADRSHDCKWTAKPSAKS